MWIATAHGAYVRILPLPESENILTGRRHAAALNALLAAGIVLRFVVLNTAGALNPDRHDLVIQYIAEHHSLPDSKELYQSFHPPLYYLLMLPLWNPQNYGPMHFASFAFSCVNLILISRLLRKEKIIPNPSARLIALAIACFSPQFVMFGSFLSNDPLAMLVGTLIFIATICYAENPTLTRLMTCAFSVGVGLLTKGTFILTGPALLLVVIFVECREKRKNVWLRPVLFCLIFAIVGCYKYVENYRNFGTPIVHNLDLGGEIYEMQRGTWKGWQSVFDVNVIELIRQPILRIHHTLSYPLLMYGTFWYPHYPDSTYQGNVTGYDWVGSTIYAIAVVPTLVFLIGLGWSVWQGILRIRFSDPQPQLVLGISSILLLSNLIVVLGAGIKYDAWSCFQSRLCFQSMMPALVIFGAGFDVVAKNLFVRRAIEIICCLTIACCLLYFAVEIGLYLGILQPGPAMIG